MKRLIAMVFATVFVLSLYACNSTSPSLTSDISTPASTSTPTQSKPENYSCILLISINPQFRLYLDENDNVLALEAVNSDADSFISNVVFENQSVEAVVENIVAQANENGFLKENTAVTFEIAEEKSGTDSSDILTKAADAAQHKAKELDVQITTEIKGDTEQPATESIPQATQNTAAPTSTPVATTQPKPTQPIHVHSFSNATCTEPQKCACGETKGSALGHQWQEASCTAPKTCRICGTAEGSASGHKWQEATCQAPKTCSVCKTTEGSTGSHKYTDGKCVYCGTKEIINPKTGLKEGADYYHISADGDGHYTLIIYLFYNSRLGVNGVYTTNTEWFDPDMGIEPITYKGKKYYPVGAGGPLPGYTLTDTEIIIKYTQEDIEELDDPYYASYENRLIVNSEHNLEVTYIGQYGMFEVGDILELIE